MAYDSRNRVSELKSIPGSWTYFQYGSADQLTRMTFGNGMRLYADYDKAGRITDWRYVKSNGQALTYFQYTRDPKGLPIRCVREGGKTIYYSYDVNDRLTRELWTTTASRLARSTDQPAGLKMWVGERTSKNPRRSIGRSAVQCQ